MPKENQKETTKDSINQRPNAESIGNIKRLIKSKLSEADNILKKSGLEDIKKSSQLRRARINIAGQILKKEIESEIDPLTQIYNLKGYQRRLSEEISRAKRYNHKLVVVALDLNNLKKINDKQGHDAGDRYIKKTADVLKNSTRLSDIASRCGGDEFRVILTETNEESAKKWLEKRAKEEFKKSGINISIGFSEVNLDNVEESIKKADERMYKEKEEYKKRERRNWFVRKAENILSMLRIKKE